MKYVITKEQRFFFEKNHYIEFEELISPKQLAILQKKIATLLIKRDLSRHDKELQKILYSLPLARIAADLSLTQSLRFGMDQLIEGTNPLFSVQSEESSIQGLACCMMLCLDGLSTKEELSTTQDGIDPFPAKPASAVFFLPETPCNPKSKECHKGQKFLLFCWAKVQAMYVLQPKDPYTHDLKKEGLVFGDRLQEKEHPLILRNRYD